MLLSGTKIFYGWFVVAGSMLVTFGVAGSQFSFGVFLKPMTEAFDWSRATLSLAFGITFMVSGLLRPLAGYLADRYSPKTTALSGVLIMGAMLMLIPLVNNLGQLLAVFTIMAIGITLGTGPVLTKIVSGWFYERRGLTLGLVASAGSFGAMFLVPGASVFLVVSSWEKAYWFLGLLLLVLVLPAGFLLIKNRPQDVGLEPLGDPSAARRGGGAMALGPLFGRDATFREALGSSLFRRLTFGYFV
jgi:sugar phosphate permease